MVNRVLIKRMVKNILEKAGIEIRIAPDLYQLSLYQEIFNEQTLQRKPFFNIGAGSFFHPYWTNIDLVSDWYKGIQTNVINFDLMSLEPLPIQSHEAEIFYTSHTIEHIKEDAVFNLFQEAYRCLKSGGIFRVTTGPDAETDFRALRLSDEHWFYWDKNYTKKGTYEKIFFEPAVNRPIEERWLHHVASALSPNDKTPSREKFSKSDIQEIINTLGHEGALDFFTGKCEFDHERPGNHISWWSHDKVIRFLKDAGFKNPYRSGYGQSISPILRNTRLFDSTHPQISLYVEAIKE